MAIAISFFRFQAGPKLEEVFHFQAGLQAGEELVRTATECHFH
jgi:hypothetical protein